MPDNRVVRHQVLLSNGRVRLGGEAERWRLFDTKAGTITFVDDIAKSARTVRLEDATTARKSLVRRPLPDRLTVATVTEEDAAPMDGFAAKKIVITSGGYRRELVLSRDPILPERLFAMKTATDPLEEENAGFMRDAVPLLLRQTGTTLSDRNELAYGDKTMSTVVRLTAVRSRWAPARLFEVPPGYTVR